MRPRSAAELDSARDGDAAGSRLIASGILRSRLNRMRAVPR